MDLDPLFPGMPDAVGALLPALISFGIILARRARSGLGTGDQFWLVVFSLALSAVLARVTTTDDGTTLHFVPGATVLVCYLVWSGYYVHPGLAFALTYATCLPVDFFLAQMLTGPDFNSERIGGGGWCDGLLILPALTALAVTYANRRMIKAGHARLVRHRPRAGGRTLESLPDKPALNAAAGTDSPPFRVANDPLPGRTQGIGACRVLRAVRRRPVVMRTDRL